MASSTELGRNVCPTCGAPATQWCHAPCCSGETGFCDYHFRGTRHERATYYGQLTGDRLPDDVAGCDADIATFAAQLAAEPPALPDVPRNFNDRREQRCADLRLIIDLLQRERAALIKSVR